MEITTIDHLELFVENADLTALRLCESYGFAVRGRGGPETGLPGCRSILLVQHEITLLITSAIETDHRAAEYVRKHGEGVAVVGLSVLDAAAAFAAAVERGAIPVAPPDTMELDGAGVTFASVNGFGDVEHRFTSRTKPGGPFAPGRIEEDGTVRAGGGLFERVDHIAVLVPAGELDETVRRYQDVFGLAQTFEEEIRVGTQAMNSKVVQNASGAVTFTIIEPDTTRDPGQIDAFIAAHGGAGVQHIALLTGDIVTAVRTVSASGVRFLTTPPAYYDVLGDRLGEVGVPVSTLRELDILADRDPQGVILQIFTETEHPRRTLFYELIDRRGARTFGSNNIKALYEAVDRHGDAATRSRRP